jgi:hypothetical protein
MSALPKILQVGVPRTGVLDITWRDGTRRQVDVSDRMRGHPLLVALRDPELFAKAEVDEMGMGIAWPNGADFCADALRIWADEQHARTRQSA